MTSYGKLTICAYVGTKIPKKQGKKGSLKMSGQEMKIEQKLSIQQGRDILTFFVGGVPVLQMDNSAGSNSLEALQGVGGTAATAANCLRSGASMVQAFYCHHDNGTRMRGLKNLQELLESLEVGAEKFEARPSSNESATLVINILRSTK